MGRWPVRIVLVVLIAGVGVAGAWAWRSLGRGRAERGPHPRPAVAPVEGTTPSDAASLARWLDSASPEERATAIGELLARGAEADAMLRALVLDRAFDLDAAWVEEFLTGIGPRAVPWLEERFLTGDGSDDMAAYYACLIADRAGRERFLVACLRNPAEHTREWAAGDIGALADEGTVFGPAVLRALAAATAATPLPEDWNLNSWGPGPLRLQLGDALAAALGDGTPLRALASDGDASVRGMAALVVPSWVTRMPRPGEADDVRTARGKVAVEVLAPLLDDPDAGVRAASVQSLGDLLYLEGIPVPAGLLQTRLDDAHETPEVRAAAARALRLHYGAETALAAHAGDPDPLVRAAVLDALCGTRGEPDPSLEPLFLRALRDDAPAVRRAAADGLAGAVPGSACRAALVAGLDDPVEEVRLACAFALGDRWAPLEAVGHLRRWLAEGSEDERAAALALAGRLGDAAATLEGPIVALLDRTQGGAFRTVVGVLAELPAAGDRTLQALAARTHDADADVRAAVLGALVQRFPEHAVTQDVLAAALDDAAPGVALPAAEALVRKGRALPEVVRACIRVLDDDTVPSWHWHRNQAIEVLGACGAAARPAVPALLLAVDAPLNEFGARALAETFGALTELAEETVPTLVDRAAGGNDIALHALAILGPRTPSTLAAAMARLPTDRRAALERALADLPR